MMPPPPSRSSTPHRRCRTTMRRAVSPIILGCTLYSTARFRLRALHLPPPTGCRGIHWQPSTRRCKRGFRSALVCAAGFQAALRLGTFAPSIAARAGQARHHLETLDGAKLLADLGRWHAITSSQHPLEARPSPHQSDTRPIDPSTRLTGGALLPVAVWPGSTCTRVACHTPAAASAGARCGWQ